MSKINDDRLYRGLDVRAEHKDKLCAHLMECYRDWFGIQFEFLIYHQKTERVEAHILVCVLALAKWRVLEQWMSGKGLGTCAGKLVTEISTIKSMDVITPVKRGETRAELTVRTVARPERRVVELLTRLDLELPTRNRILGEPRRDPDDQTGLKM